ncbi:hypothetical protein K8S17_06280, partial [bacterium]|nr:hypothetical protein [bacterium]
MVAGVTDSAAVVETVVPLPPVGPEWTAPSPGDSTFSLDDPLTPPSVEIDDVQSTAADTLAFPGAFASADTVAPADTVAAVPRDPFAVGIAFAPESDAQFVRPWDAFTAFHWWTEKRSNRVVRTGALSLPLTRETSYDLETESVLVELVSSGGVRFTAYAAPLSEQLALALDGSRSEAWLRTIARDLGRIGAG